VRAVAWASSLLFLVLLAREAVVRRVTAPARTVASRTGTSPRDSENALLLLRDAERTIPRGASVSFFKPARRSDDQLMYLIALGQLPHHRVVFPESVPQYVIAFQTPFDDPHFHLVCRFDVGAVYVR